MLRQDGEYIIFIIQHKYKDKKVEGWSNSGDCGQFFPNGPFTEKEWRTKHKEIDYFNASGDCWQDTGVHGTYDLNEAFQLLVKVIQWAPEHRFRIARIEIKQKTEQVAEAKGNESKSKEEVEAVLT